MPQPQRLGDGSEQCLTTLSNDEPATKHFHDATVKNVSRQLLNPGDETDDETRTAYVAMITRLVVMRHDEDDEPVTESHPNAAWKRVTPTDDTSDKSKEVAGKSDGAIMKVGNEVEFRGGQRGDRFGFVPRQGVRHDIGLNSNVRMNRRVLEKDGPTMGCKGCQPGTVRGHFQVSVECVKALHGGYGGRTSKHVDFLTAPRSEHDRARMTRRPLVAECRVEQLACAIHQVFLPTRYVLVILWKAAPRT